MRQLVYNMFISNNRAPLHLRWKESLVKHQKVSKYILIILRLYENLASLIVSTVSWHLWKKRISSHKNLFYLLFREEDSKIFFKFSCLWTLWKQNYLGDFCVAAWCKRFSFRKAIRKIYRNHFCKCNKMLYTAEKCPIRSFS